MTDHAIDHAAPRVASIDRYSPAVLLSLAVLFGLLARSLFYRSALGINIGIASIVVLAVAYRLRRNRARIDRLDRWIAPAAVLLVFALLFASAAAVFSSAITNLFDFRNWSIGELIGRVLVAATFAWVAGGLFLLAGRGADTTMSPLLPRLRGLLSSTAGATTLIAVDALFVFFVGLQIAYLFGGIDTLNATGLSYSTYARRGFS